MKTIITKISILLVLATTINTAKSQTVAVAPIRTFGVFVSESASTTMARLELIALKKYQVMDKFDMLEIDKPESYDSCYGKSCLMNLGKELGVDYVLSGNIDGLGHKIVVNLKLLDIKNGTISKTHSGEFESQESEIQRMIGIVLSEMHGVQPDPELKKRLTFNNEVITTNRINQVTNSGPRIGVGYAYGTLNEFMMRSEDKGGLGMFPVTSLMGYQFEAQYVGNEDFSALFECLVNVAGLEQGKVMPSITFMNGFRFGKAGWEIAAGPGFGIKRTYIGFFDTNGTFGEAGKFWNHTDFSYAGHTDSELEEAGYEMKRIAHKDGYFGINTRWVVAAGRSFRSGALNVPVNVFYSSMRGGGMVGLNVGFNITRSSKRTR
jgi:hypothetical protein